MLSGGAEESRPLFAREVRERFVVVDPDARERGSADQVLGDHEGVAVYGLLAVMPKFLLILRGDPSAWQSRAPAEIEAVIGEFERWAGRLMAQHRFLDGKKLADGEGVVLARDGATVTVTDGPYGETKELVGGFHLIEADSYEHAVALCRDHPELSIGGSVEIRRLDPMGQTEA